MFKKPLTWDVLYLLSFVLAPLLLAGAIWATTRNSSDSSFLVPSSSILSNSWEAIEHPANSIRIYRMEVKNKEDNVEGYLVLSMSSGGEGPHICWLPITTWKLEKKK